MEGRKVAGILKATGDEEVATEFLVSGTANPVELSELTADPDLPGKIADLSGGSLAGIHNAQDLVDGFGPGNRKIVERNDISLWDSWKLFVLMMGVVTTEWILRKRGGLS